MAPAKRTGKRPTAAEEKAFWAAIEAAWQGASARAIAERDALVTRDPDADEDDEPHTEAVDDALVGVTERLRAHLETLDREALVAFDRVMERKLHEIDREDVHDVTDGSDDGFLSARGFIVALGRAFYEKVAEDPSFAVLDAEHGDICYLAAHVHEERFGEMPKTESGISRESGANPDGWS